MEPIKNQQKMNSTHFWGGGGSVEIIRGFSIFFPRLNFSNFSNSPKTFEKFPNILKFNEDIEFNLEDLIIIQGVK